MIRIPGASPRTFRFQFLRPVPTRFSGRRCAWALALVVAGTSMAQAQESGAWKMPESPEDLAGAQILPLTESELPAFAAKAESDPARRAELVDLLRKASVVPWTPAERDTFVTELEQLQQCEAGRGREDRDDSKIGERMEAVMASGELERQIRDYARLVEVPELATPLDAPSCGRTELMKQMRELAMLPMTASMLGPLTGPRAAHQLRGAGMERLFGSQMMGGRCAPSETFVRLLMTTPDNPRGLRTADDRLRCKTGPAYSSLWSEAEYTRLMAAMPQVRQCLARGNDHGFDLEGATARFADSPELPRLFKAAYELLAHVGISKPFGYELPADAQGRSNDLLAGMLNVGTMVEQYHEGAEISSPAGARQLQATGLLALYIARLAPETCNLPNDFVPLLKLNSLADPS